MIFLTILYGLLGWVAGIAINHAADILPRRQTLAQRPACAACGAVRPYPAWSALLALVTGRRACDQCGCPRATFWRAVLVELAMPALFVFLLGRFGFSPYLGIVSVYTAILGLITVTDLEHRLIFNVVVLPSILLAIALAFVTPPPYMYWPSALVGGAVGFILSYTAALLSRGGLGEGDVTLSTFLGLVIGFPRILMSLGFGVFLGGFVAFFLLISGRAGMRTFIPYGPFLTITGWIMLVWGIEIWAHYFW